MKTSISGIKPTGTPTLGNYLGATVNWVKFQETHKAYYFLADMHAITVRQEPEKFTENSYAGVAWFMAAGLTPQKATIFVQSHVHQHAELGWILNTFTQMGELERMTQFKDKSRKHKENINAGLFTYPTLMAADILLYNVNEVPVGEDQTQHLELARNIAVRFNNLYGDVFTVPKAVLPKTAARVKDLQAPSDKMSKSDGAGGCIFLSDDLKTIEKKIKRAVTDNEARVAYDWEAQPGVSNLLEIYAVLRGKDIPTAVADFEGQQYGTFKQAVADAVVDTVGPMQQRFADIMADRAGLEATLKNGAEQAQQEAAITLKKVKDAVGFLPA